MEKRSSEIYNLSAFVGNEFRDIIDIGNWGYDNLRFKRRSWIKNMEHMSSFVRR